MSGQELTGDEILAQARGLVKAGVFSLVLELVPADLATRITSEIPVPTIGIGAGNGTDAQVLVWSDLMGLTPNAPKLAKAYRNLREKIASGVDEWAKDVASGVFPGAEQSFK